VNSLSRQHEAQHFTRLRKTGDTGIRDALICKHLPLAHHAARRFHELRDADDQWKQSEIARRLGISQMHVSRLLRRTLDELSKKVEEPALAS
jgi:DNA-directed RNA polymerase specialized sigma subunit